MRVKLTEEQVNELTELYWLGGWLGDEEYEKLELPAPHESLPKCGAPPCGLPN